MAGLLIILLEGLAVLYIVVTWFFVRRLRRPPRRTYASAVSRGKPGDPGELPTPRAFRAWTFRVTTSGARVWRDAELPAWEIDGDDPSGPVAIMSPGWGDSRVGALARIPALAPLCSRIIAWDPPGQGEAPGLCLLGTREHEAILELVDRALDPAFGEAAPRGGRAVVLYGWSLGAGNSIVAAANAEPERPILGVIAEAPYRLPWTPAFNVTRLAGMPYRLNGPAGFALLGLRLGVGPLWRGFDRAEHAARLRVPLLVLHGDADPVCPIDDGRAIAHAAPKGRIVELPGASHNDLWTDDRFAPRSAEAVQTFIRAL